MRITSLQQQVRNPERTNIYVDGKFLLAVNALIVLKMGLKNGQELSHEQLEQLRQEETEQQAFERALNYLSFRPHSREEVRRYLIRKETPEPMIDSALERLVQLNLLNDHEFTSFWIEARSHANPKGARALKNELQLKGVERDVIDEMVDDEQDETFAYQAAQKKARSLLNQSAMDFNTFRNKLGPFLQRRGFNYDVIKRVVRTLWEEHSAEQIIDDNDESL